MRGESLAWWALLTACVVIAGVLTGIVIAAVVEVVAP